MVTDLAIKLLIFLLGLVLGNRLAIGRDKRKEYNEVADLIYSALAKEAKSIKSNGAVAYGPDYSDLDDLSRRMPFYNKSKFNKALENYKLQRNEKNRKQDNYGQPFYVDPEKIIISINELIKFTNRK